MNEKPWKKNKLSDSERIDLMIEELERLEEQGLLNLQEEPRGMHPVLEFFVYATIVITMTFLIVTFVGQRTMVSGDSMYPTLNHADHLFVDKLSYRFTKPERFDIVVFRYLYRENTYYIKRIIGLPGETVQIVDDVIYIDGVALEEDYGYEPMLRAGRAEEPITLGPDEYFVLGDNRNDSSDSRDPAVGNVAKSQIVGRAFVRVWPLDRLGFIKHQ